MGEMHFPDRNEQLESGRGPRYQRGRAVEVVDRRRGLLRVSPSAWAPHLPISHACTFRLGAACVTCCPCAFLFGACFRQAGTVSAIVAGEGCRRRQRAVQCLRMTSL